MCILSIFSKLLILKNVLIIKCEHYPYQMHYILHGSGFQTWEYSPVYAIRSYAYLWIHVAPLKVYAEIILANKVESQNIIDLYESLLKIGKDHFYDEI